MLTNLIYDGFVTEVKENPGLATILRVKYSPSISCNRKSCKIVDEITQFAKIGACPSDFQCCKCIWRKRSCFSDLRGLMHIYPASWRRRRRI